MYCFLRSAATLGIVRGAHEISACIPTPAHACRGYIRHGNPPHTRHIDVNGPRCRRCETEYCEQSFSCLTVALSIGIAMGEKLSYAHPYLFLQQTDVLSLF